VEQGAPEAVSVQYPLSDLRYRDLGTGYNVLLITVDNLNYSRFEKNMPALAGFAKENVNFTQHMSSGNTADSGMFGLFYGISPSYMDGVLSARIPAALITSLNQQGYQLGLFSSDGFSSPLYRQALLSDFSLPAAKAQSDEQTATSGLTGWTATPRMKTAGSRGFRSTAPPLTTGSSKTLSAATATPPVRSIRKLAAC
jgi:membrane-anchored protein YejM (alkaline phosphatase superfamily)